MSIHLSDSAAQSAAEGPILEWSSSEEGMRLPTLGRNQTVTLPDGHSVVVDGRAADDTAFVEVYARASAINGAGFHKVARDILTLRLIREQHPEATLVIAFASPTAADSVRGWLRGAAATAGIRLVGAVLPDQLRDDLLAAQARQRMVNPPPAPEQAKES